MSQIRVKGKGLGREGYGLGSTFPSKHLILTSTQIETLHSGSHERQAASYANLLSR